MHLAEFRGHLEICGIENRFECLLAHGGPLLAIAALLERIVDLFTEHCFALKTEEFSEFAYFLRSNALGLFHGEVHRDRLATKFFALVRICAHDCHSDCRADALAEQRSFEPFEDHAQQSALAFVFLRRDDAQRVLRFKVCAFATFNGDDCFADHTVEVLEWSLDANRGAEAVALAQEFAVDVLLLDLHDWALHSERVGAFDFKIRQRLDVDLEDEWLATLKHGNRGAFDLHWLRDRTQRLCFERLLIGLSHDLLTRLRTERITQALFEERSGRLAFAEAWNLRASSEALERSVEASVHSRSWNGQRNSLRARCGVSDLDVNFDRFSCGGH